MASAIASSSTAPSTSSLNSPLEESRPQAGPLPKKRGEIGYQEELHETAQGEASSSSSEPASLPERHPADRDHPPTLNASTTTLLHLLLPLLPHLLSPRPILPLMTPLLPIR
ncbi:hypothetical protein D9758_015187 [Tetrapyrgos nigripes]|uniref:Uncharacterized protein n=1 Tax=Tetrapyrgos nigripes TaxID=182062 RepID=A0A8H5C139_9AGAR|nr:hypothetical protein D9758_015187 [Tetrapyrgos nigripes]